MWRRSTDRGRRTAIMLFHRNLKLDIVTKQKKTADVAPRETAEMLRHWHDAVPNDRLAHLVKDATRSFVRALQMRLAEHEVSFGHWTFLRILWETDGLTQRDVAETCPIAFRCKHGNGLLITYSPTTCS
jgi:hypothetical protein